MSARTLAVTVVLAVAVAACGSSGSTGGGTTDGMDTVELGYIPYNGSAPMFLGMEQGFFEDHGIELKPAPAQAPAAIIASLVGGQRQFGFTTVVALIAAVSQGTAVKCVTPVDGVVATAIEDASTATVVLDDSPYQTQKDLQGAKVGVVALSSQNHLFTLAEMALDGGDPEDVEVIQLPFPQMDSALRDQRVDAIVTTEPFLSATLAEGGRVVNYPEIDLNPEGNGTCLAATDEFLQENPDLAQRFTDAMTESISYARDHKDEALATIPSFMEITPEEAQQSIIGVTYDPELNVDSVERFQQLMLEHGFIDEPVPMDRLIYQPDP